ncbi:MAG: heparan-alpha-glucosaminide N-acetyltransferase domain-containing protein [Vicinamibacterales bacterium]
MTTRLTSIDALRGAVMIIMALDHVRDFVHRAAMSSSPTDLATTTPILFMTRWVTHFCAPVFMFTAGLGAFFWWNSGRTRRQLSGFLASRGIWLIALELTLMQLAYNFNFAAANPIFLLVLWVLGACMVGMAGLVWLPIRWLGILSVAMIVLHNLLDPVRAPQFGAAAWAWNLFHQVGAFQAAGKLVIVGYPLVPWVAVMATGFCFGPILLKDPETRRRDLLWIGLAATLAFVVIRAVNIYGDPAPWSVQPSAVMTALSFLNVTKYPPSLAFVLMTLGPALVALALFDRRTLTPANPLVVFGRAPLFYFVLHFYAAHVAVAVLALIRYGAPALAFIFHPVPSMGGPKDLYPAGFGYDLWVAYAVWAAIVVGLFPFCGWFAGVKARRRDWWLTYL